MSESGRIKKLAARPITGIGAALGGCKERVHVSMANQLCFRCFKVKGDYEVCPYCGYVENTEAEQACQLAPGTILRERYIIGTSIGIGGFGITYKAFDTALGFVAAVKEFYPAGLVSRAEGEMKVGVFSGEKEAEFKRQLARFLEEARNLAVFSKEKDIINVYDYFEENQTAYIIMEYVDAPLLKERLKEGKLPAGEAAGYMLALLDVLEKIHSKGIVHKDISPDNIFLTGPDSVKLFDFGAAKFEGTGAGRTDAVVVKAGYTPPEQYSLKNEQGAVMDIYAAGAVFYEMLTGEKPMDALDRTVKDELKRFGEFGIAADENIERVVLKAMALDPKLRFQTAEQFKKAVVSRKKTELPEEIIKRKRMAKRLVMAGAAAAIVLAGGIILLSQTVFSGRGRIDVANIAEEEMEVWLLAEEDDIGKELSKMLLAGVEQECPQLTVDVKVFGRDDYADRIQRAASEDCLPDVFCTDSILASDYCADVSKLLHTMKLSSYLYLSGLEKAGEVYELPTAVQVGAAYVNREKIKELPKSIELRALRQGDVFGNADGADILGYADEADIFARFQDKKEPAAVIAGDLSDMEKVEQVTIESVPPTDFAAVPILQEGKLIGIFKNKYGVSKDAAGNRKEAGMFLLSLLLGDGIQSAAYMGSGAGIPLNRAVFEDYMEYKTSVYLAFLNTYDLEDAAVYENGSMCEAIREESGGSGK